MPAPRPAEGVTVTTNEGAPPRCPRCRAIVAGDYKFCPACAFRLRVGLDDDAPPVARRSPWKSAFFVATGVAVALGCAFLGLLLFAPTLFERERPETPTAPAIQPELAKSRITVAEIATDLVELDTNGFAQDYPLEQIPGLSDEERARLARELRGPTPTLEARIRYALRVMRYEVTRGQYAEFLADVEAHRERIPEYWRQQDHAKTREEVDVSAHVPEPWKVRDAAGEPAGWRLDDADRNLPVTHVSIADAHGFAEWAAAKLGIPTLHVPYVMEWVRAARAGRRENVWPWGRDRLFYACNNLAGIGHPLYVQYRYSEPLGGDGGATDEGLLAMAGNVAEWALDHGIEIRTPPIAGDPYVEWVQKATRTPLHFACGGSYRSGIDDCQVDAREVVGGGTRNRDDIGFRLVAFPQ